MHTKIVLKNITRYLNYKAVFAPVSLQAKSKQVWHISGVNGVGKSTFLKIMAGLIYHQGVCQIDCGIAYLGHKNGLYRQLSALENLMYFSLWSDNAKSNFKKQLNDWQIPINKPVAKLSSGQQQTVSLLRVMAENKTCWLLDEPSHSLDDRKVSLLQESCLKHLANGGLIFFTSHLKQDSLYGLVTNKLVLQNA